MSHVTVDEAALQMMLNKPGSDILIILVAVAAWSWAGVAAACAICIPYPTRTEADLLIDSKTVALARENADKPYSFRIVDTVKGQVFEDAVDLFLDSQTRRQLAMNPESAVVLVQSADSAWRSLGYADGEFEALVRLILEHSNCWRSGDSCKPSRAEFFAPLLGHDDRRVHQLAYVEVSRAPYTTIKQFSRYWSADNIRELLRNLTYYEWFPLAILMLAHNGDQDDRRYIEERFLTSARLRVSLNLSAWATAFVEVRREQGVATIEAQYFQAPGRQKKELDAIVQALSEHGSNGHTDLRPRIARSYAVLIKRYPAMASYVATDLMRWSRWELAPDMAQILRSGEPDPLTKYVIRMYLARAASAANLDD